MWGIRLAEAKKDKLKVYEIAIFLAFFVALFTVSYRFIIPHKDSPFRREISVHDRSHLSAQEYMKMMYWVSDLTVLGILDDWPRREDIPYLRSLIESQRYTGTAYCEGSNSFERIGRSFITFDTYYGTTESIAALNLLEAIKNGKFEGYFQSYPSNNDEIIAWARAESARMKAGE